MTKLLIVNPNSTASMTAKIGEAAHRAARAGTEVLAVNDPQAPPSIQGFYDVAQCLPALLSQVEGHSDVDAAIIACFDDTGLDAARCAIDVPVIGIGEAAFHVASMLSCKFSVVTTLRRSVPGIEANLMRYGLSARCWPGAGERCARAGAGAARSRDDEEDHRRDRARYR